MRSKRSADSRCFTERDGLPVTSATARHPRHQRIRSRRRPATRHRNRPGWTRSPAGEHTRNSPRSPGRRGSRLESVSTRLGSVSTRSGSVSTRSGLADTRLGSEGSVRTRPGCMGRQLGAGAGGRRAVGTRPGQQARLEGRESPTRGGNGCPGGGKRRTANPTFGTRCQERSCGKASRENGAPDPLSTTGGDRPRSGRWVYGSFACGEIERSLTRLARQIVESQVG